MILNSLSLCSYVQYLIEQLKEEIISFWLVVLFQHGKKGMVEFTTESSHNNTGQNLLIITQQRKPELEVRL